MDVLAVDGVDEIDCVIVFDESVGEGTLPVAIVGVVDCVKVVDNSVDVVTVDSLIVVACEEAFVTVTVDVVDCILVASKCTFVDKRFVDVTVDVLDVGSLIVVLIVNIVDCISVVENSVYVVAVGS